MKKPKKPKNPRKPNRYERVIEKVFLRHYEAAAATVDFQRQEMIEVAAELGISVPKNIGDVLYSFRNRTQLPEEVQRRAPNGKTWAIMPAGRAKYRFFAVNENAFVPKDGFSETKVPDSTPGIISKYSLSDEQALLAILRYNRLIDIFTGVTCYSLQNHLRTAVPDVGQLETDEIYVGVDRKGAHYVFPVQAKGGNEKLNIVQLVQDFAMCQHKFASLICRPIGAQFMDDNVIALLEFEETRRGISILSEKHYRLVPAEELSESDLEEYARRAD
jgi:hypothetical protein